MKKIDKMNMLIVFSLPCLSVNYVLHSNVSFLFFFLHIKQNMPKETNFSQSKISGYGHGV